MNYEKDTQIDCDALDIEWLDQPALMMKYTRYAAETKMEADQIKEKMDLIKAELDKKIRLNPESFGIEKITETVIFNTILTQNIYQQVNEEYIITRFEQQVAQGAVSAMEHRKTALENLVKLHGQQYFAGPKVPRDLSWEVQERQKRADQTVNKRLRRTQK